MFSVMDFSFLENFSKEGSDFQTKCQEITSAVTNKKITILELVESLGPLLINPDNNKRELGTFTLSQILEGLSSDFLDERQLSFLCDFYSDRLKDSQHVIPAVLKGILALLHFTQFPNIATVKLLNCIFQNVSCQAQLPHHRGIIYKIFATLQDKCYNEIISMGYDYVYGVISAVDGERDPKNLIFLFGWMPKFFKTVKLGHLTEEAFEIMACYFPVDFKAPPQDPNGITRDDLANALVPCLTAIPEFAEFCLPLAIEKLQSSLVIAKLDSLQLLRRGCAAFEAPIYIENTTVLWSQIQKEITSCTDLYLEKELLLTLTEIIRKISVADDFQTTLKDIIDTIRGNLLPDSKYFNKSTKFLIAIASATPFTSLFISQNVTPLLENTFNITESPEKRAKVLEALVDLQSPNVGILALKATVDSNDDLRAVGFKSLGKVVLASEIKSAVFQNLGALLTIPQNEKVRQALLFCLGELGRKYPEETIEFLKELKIVKLDLYLDGLLALIDSNCYTKFILNKYLEYLLNKETTALAMPCFRVYLQTAKYKVDVNTLEQILDWVLKEQPEINNDIYYDNLMKILNALLELYDTETQKYVIAKYLNGLSLKQPFHIFVMSGLLIKIKREVPLDYSFLDDLTHLSQTDDLKGEIAKQLLANLINKCEKEETLKNYLEKLSHLRIPHPVIAWISKALFMRSHPKGDFWINELVKLLKEDNGVAPDFRILMKDDFECLSTNSFCIRNIFYQQKLLVIVSKKLCDGYTEEKPQFLTALGYLLEYAPLQIVTIHLEKIIKFVILCLQSEINGNPDVLSSLLKTINVFIINKDNCLQHHLTDFLNNLLKLSVESPFMNVRIQALQCLTSFVTSGWEIQKLQPFKEDVLSGLQKSIDDKKRLVRKEAMAARLYWFLLDGPY